MVPSGILEKRRLLEGLTLVSSKIERRPSDRSLPAEQCELALVQAESRYSLYLLLPLSLLGVRKPTCYCAEEMLRNLNVCCVSCSSSNLASTSAVITARPTIDLERPKSQILMLRSSLIKTFAGFKSRWTTFASCRSFSAFNRLVVITRTCDKVRKRFYLSSFLRSDWQCSITT